MQEENVADVKMEGQDGGLSYKRKYKEMKQKVKYLAYEHECFQHDLQKAQEKLLQIAKDKSCLLDQLLRYETVLLSDDDEQTDYSTEEEEDVDTPFFNRAEFNSKSSASGNQKTSPKPSHPKQQGTPKQLLPTSPKVTETSPKFGTKRQQRAAGGVATGAGASSGANLLSSTSKIAKTVAKVHTTSAASTTTTTTTTTSTTISTTPNLPTFKVPALPPQLQPLPPQPSALVVSLPLGQLGPKVKQLQQHFPASSVTVPPAQVLLSDLPPLLAPPPLLSSSSSPHNAVDGHRHVPASSSSSSDSNESGSSSDSSSSSDEGEVQSGGPVPMMSGVHSNMVAKNISSQLVRPKALTTTSPKNPPPPPKLIFVGDSPSVAMSHSTASPPLSVSSQQQPSSQPVGVFTWSNRQQQHESSPSAGPPGFMPIVPTLSSPTFNKPSPGSAFHVVSPKYDSKPSVTL